MEEKSEKSQSNKSFKIIIMLLTFTMVGSLFYIYKVSDRSKTMIISLREQKSIVLKDLEKSKLFLDQAMTSNKSLSKKLASEQAKIKQLILELQTTKLNEKTIIVYKKSADNVDERINLLFEEINSYKNKIDSTNVVLTKERTKVDTLTTSNKKLVKKINEAAKLYFYNLQSVTFRDKGAGKFVETDKASRVDLLKISFMIAESKLAKTASKEFYIQIIDSKNNVIGLKNTIKFGDQELVYSTILKVNYENKTMKVEGGLPVSDLEKGAYFINVFDNAKLILNSDFTLQ